MGLFNIIIPYNLILFVIDQFLSLMSFFFAPILPNSANYCIFMPILPYIMTIPEQKTTNLNFQQSNEDQKSQFNGQLYIQNQKQTSSIRRYTDSNQQNLSEKNYCANNFTTKSHDFVQSEKKVQQFEETLNRHLEESKIELKQQISKIRFISKQAKTIKIKRTKPLTQEEYRPFQKKKKMETYSRQNQNRNIIPNEVNQIFSYIQKSSKSKFVVSRIFKKYPPTFDNYTLKKFYLYQSLLKEKISNYISQGSLSLVTELYEPRCEIYSEHQQRYYNKVCRILIYHFLQQDSIFNILTSRRMHKDKKKNHLEMRRVLKQKVIKILRH